MTAHRCPCDAGELTLPCYSWEQSRICVCLDFQQEGKTPS